MFEPGKWLWMIVVSCGAATRDLILRVPQQRRSFALLLFVLLIGAATAMARLGASPQLVLVVGIAYVLVLPAGTGQGVPES